MNTAPLALRLEMKRTIAAPIERVYAAWTDLEQFRQWMGCGQAEFKRIQGDVRPGGGFRLQINQEGRESILHAKYREVVPPSRLVFTWRFENSTVGMVEETVVTVDFRSVGGKTEIHLVHEGFSTDEFCHAHEEGWTICLDKLEKWTAK